MATTLKWRLYFAFAICNVRRGGNPLNFLSNSGIVKKKKKILTRNFFFILFYVRDKLESDLEFEVEGDVPAPRPLSPEPGPSTEPNERENQAVTGKF